MLEIRIESNVSGIFTGIFSAPIWCKFISRDFRLKRRVYRAFSGLLQFVFHGFRYLIQLSHLEGLTKENFQHSCGSFYKGLSTILAKLIGSDCHRKLNNLEGQVDSKLRQQINEKKVAQGLKISYTPVDDDDEDEDEDEDFGFIL